MHPEIVKIDFDKIQDKWTVQPQSYLQVHISVARR